MADLRPCRRLELWSRDAPEAILRRLAAAVLLTDRDGTERVFRGRIHGDGFRLTPRVSAWRFPNRLPYLPVIRGRVKPRDGGSLVAADFTPGGLSFAFWAVCLVLLLANGLWAALSKGVAVLGSSRPPSHSATPSRSFASSWKSRPPPGDSGR